MNERIAEYSDYLSSRGIRTSVQRVAIYSYLRERKNHPTADRIYGDLKDSLPGLSKTTIYNTMDLFIEKGVVIPLQTEKNELRFDADTSLHAHFKCASCGEVYDLFEDSFKIELNLPEGFSASGISLVVNGTCRGCGK